MLKTISPFTLRIKYFFQINNNHRNIHNATVSAKQTDKFRVNTNTTTENQQNKQEKLLKVAIIGVPNAGKSTFINNLTNHRICPVSRKVHTTRTFSKAISTKNNCQIILFDTPGLVSEREIRKHHLEPSFISACRHSIQHSDFIGVIHDVSNSWTRNELHKTVLDTLTAYPKVPSFLVLNKIDAIRSKRILLDLTRILTLNTIDGKEIPEQKRSSSSLIRLTKKEARKTGKLDQQNEKDVIINKNTTESEIQSEKERIIGWAGFSDVFMISSLTGDGVPTIMKYLTSKAKPKSWEYPSNELSDQPPEELIVQSVRARLLDFLPDEIPYSLKCELEYYTAEEKGNIFASVQVTCPSERIARFVCGEKDGKLKQITDSVTSDLIETFGQPIMLTITTRVVNKSV